MNLNPTTSLLFYDEYTVEVRLGDEVDWFGVFTTHKEAAELRADLELTNPRASVTVVPTCLLDGFDSYFPR